MALFFMLLSSLCYVVGYSLTKLLTGRFDVPPLQITFVRCGFVLAAGSATVLWRRGSLRARILEPRLAWAQRAAAALLVLANILAITAYALMPVTTATALTFLTPLFVVALGGWLLRERVGTARWIGTVIGFAGMLLIVHPGGGTPVLGVAVSVVCAVSYAGYQIMTRRLRDVASAFDMAVQVAFVGTIGLALPAWALWHPPSPSAWALLVAFVSVQTLALVSLNLALQRAEVSRIAPWQYTELIWAMLIDLGLFGNLPPGLSLLGGLLIVGGGLLAQRRSAP
ncbi:MAG: DMT family transporter [Pseudolabrys sp.]